MVEKEQSRPGKYIRTRIKEDLDYWPDVGLTECQYLLLLLMMLLLLLEQLHLYSLLYPQVLCEAPWHPHP